MTGAGIGRLLQIPDLSGEQRQKLIDRDRQLQRQLLQLESKALDAQFALQDATRTDTPDPKAVGRALQNVYSVRAQMVEAAIAAANDARSMLTEEQRASLAQQRGMGMGGMGMGGMPGRMMPR
jgi:Spy/CpxP family protein refolding chaperone